MLTPSDYNALAAYFADGRAERSIFGGMLDAAELYSHHYHEAHSGVVDVQPTREIREVTREGPDDAQLQRIGRVSRRLSALGKQDPTSYTVLATWFGDAGVRYEGGPGGRLDALLIMTATGKDLLRRMAKKERGS